MAIVFSTYFVALETNADGIAYVKHEFGGSSQEWEVLGGEELRGLALSGWRPFWPLCAAEEKLGISLFHLESIESALWLQQIGKPGGPPGYDILIDIEKNIVYIKALRI